MLRSGELKIAKEKLYAPNILINICDLNINNTINISKFQSLLDPIITITTIIIIIYYHITNSKYLIGYLDSVIRPLLLILFTMSRYIKAFKVKDGHKDKNNKLISFGINGEKLLEKYKAIWTKIFTIY